MNPDHPVATANSISRMAGTALALGLFAAAMWFAWLGWDQEYHLVNGVPQGPYRTWQVVGCGLSIAAVSVLAAHLLRRHFPHRPSADTSPTTIMVLAAAADIGFAVPWAVNAATTDETGLWVVGLLFLLVGGGGALVVLLAVTEATARYLRRFSQQSS